MVALGVGNLILLISAVLIFLPRKRFREVLDYFVKYRFYLLLISVIVALHLLEVNLVDGYTTSLVGRDFASLFESLEGNTVFWFSLHWSPVLLLFFVIIYLVVYSFTLWFSPLLFVVSGEKNALRSLAYGLVVIYILALPFYLFFPVTNVYTHYNLSSALNNVIPSVENFFYATTTHNNCFPSLHVAMALLIAKSSSLTSNKRYRFFTLFCAILVIASVIYLSIHWLIDVLGGVIVFLVAAVVIDYVNSIESEVLRRVTPSFRDRKRINRTVVLLIQEVKKYCEKNKIKAVPLLVGSVAKDTYLRDSVDIDLFLLFPKSTPRDILEKQGLSVGRALLKNTEERYAEHPYVRGEFNGFDVEIVPCYRIKNPSERMSAVDRTPFHTDYVKKHLSIWGRDQVRLLKQFLKGVGCYGAEAEVEGFSGYLCELLIIKYGSFKRLLKAAKEWRVGKTVINIRGVKATEFFDPLVVIDPVDPNRNVASALSNEKFSLFIHACREYLHKPSITFFFPKSVKPLSLNEIETRLSGKNIVGIKIMKPDIISDNLYPQVRKSLRRIKASCEKEGFEIVDYKFVVKKDKVYLIMKAKELVLPETFIHEGPPDEKREHVKSFREKWNRDDDVVRKPYLKNGRWYVEVKRRFRDIKDFLEHELPRMSLGKEIQGTIKKYGFSVLQLNELITEDLQEFWTEYLDKKPPWER